MIAPAKDEEVHAGSQYPVVWEKGTQPETATFTLTLLQGEAQKSLQLGAVIASKFCNHLLNGSLLTTS